MFWNDIAEIKSELAQLKNLVICMQNKACTDSLGRDMEEVVKDSIIDILDCEDEYSILNRIYTKVEELNEVLLSQKTMDKFDDYMQNVEKLNSMINEFKGCVSMARGALEDRKKAAEEEGKTAVLADMTKEIYKAMLSFIKAGETLEHKAHYKIDAIYKAICESEDKKVTKKGKFVRKKNGMKKRTVEVLEGLESE